MKSATRHSRQGGCEAKQGGVQRGKDGAESSWEGMEYGMEIDSALGQSSRAGNMVEGRFRVVLGLRGARGVHERSRE